MQINTLPFQVLVLLTQEDIAIFRAGKKPLNILDSSFATQAELEAYVSAFDVYDDAEVGVDKVVVVGSKVTFDVIEGGFTDHHGQEFDTPAEAQAFRQGLEDAEGYEAPMVLTQDQDAFEQLKAMVEESSSPAADQVPVPTIIVYKSGDQITRVVASQAVRVVVLDADTEGLEEDAPRTLTVGDQELYVTDLDVAGAVGSSPAGEHGVDPVFVDQMLATVMAMPAHSETRSNVPGAFAEGFPVLKSVPVKYWDDYADRGSLLTHQIDIEDQRLTSGQAYLTVGALDGKVDDLVSVTAEVNKNPLNGIDNVPCLHVHFDSDALAFSLFKVGDKLVLSPETDVSIDIQYFDIDGRTQGFFIVE
jgi:hypothetical protein